MFPQGPGSAPVAAGGADGGWRAELELAYRRRDGRTVPVTRRHAGPLRVLKALRPEGDAVLHEIVVHPPGGLVGGDTIAIDIRADEGAEVLMTTPGATKWYRARTVDPVGPALQSLRVRAGPGSRVEWLPLESIVFDGARAHWDAEIDLSGDGGYIGVDLVCLGRPAAGERFEHGSVGWRTIVRRDDRECFFEQVRIEGGSRAMDAPAGLAGFPACGTLLAVPPTRVQTEDCLAALAGMHEEASLAITALPGVVVARWRGDEVQHGWRALRAAWARLRPAFAGRAPCAPRIWAS